MDISRDESFAAQRHGRRSLQTLEAMLDAGSPAVRDQQISKTFKRRSTALNVQKSIQLLDESVGSPSAKGWRTPGGTLRHSTYTPRLLSSGTKFDVSTRLGPTPKKTPQGNRSLQRSLHDDSLQSSFHNTSGLRPLQEEDVTEDITTTNVGLLLEEDPGISASKGLFEDFLQCLKAHPSEGELFVLVEEYEKTCQEQVIMLKKLITHASRQEEKFRKTFQVLHELFEEEATWKLIKSLFRDRQDTSMKEDFMMEQGDEDEQQVIQGIYQSDEKIVNALFDREQSVREAQLVVDWLESCAQDDCENFAENIKFFSDRAVGYENARHRLQNQQMGVPTGAERNLITELDPDAPVRQNKLLDDLDKEDEDRLLQYIFVCLRAGQLEKAQKMCLDCGQAWRAATLEGWKLFHDPNFEGLGPECQRKAIQGNPHRDIWKTVCWNMAQDARVSTYEKAIYSALCGNLRGILPVCKSWLDYVWAYFRVLVDRKVEDEIRLKTTINRSLEALPGEYWEKNLTTRSVFKEIEANDVMQKEAGGLYHLIQKYVILGDVSGLLDLLYERVRQQGQDISLHTLRFMAHFVLFLRTSEQNTKEELCNSILKCYVERLIREKHYGLIAYYVSKLPKNAQVHWYALFLEGITNKDERQHYLDLAEDAGLDLAAVTKKVVENIRMKSDVDFSRIHEMQDSVDTVISEEDRHKIEAIDWLVFDIAQRAEALKQANAVMRTFIAMKKIDAARAVFEKLPPDSVDVVHKTWLQQTGTTTLPAEDRNAVREYLCIKAYLDAMESFNDWIQHYHHGQPTRPAPPEGGSFTDRVAYEQRMKQFEQERERWHRNLLMQTQTTKDHIYNVLLFADGGWMADQIVEEADENIADRSEGDVLRQEQMDRLRRLVLPGLVFLLHNVLHTSEQYQECVRLADMLTSEQHKLYQVFRQDEIQRVLHLLRESSLKLLDQGRDPLGYERS
ncbi:nuclear pore complex protein Nup107-like [Mercenaria mercenaria]|uniref:nuclear pore complex protein Nup107-like n=1 Tax=Mercenaria mercenaria TaxID=6596 RepID=UPI00234F06BA|nr:nuclear pore complex protein Nup107-like [Mercenaria mercenaria]